MRLVYNSGDRLTGFVGASIMQDDSILPYYIMVDPFVRGTFDAVKAQLEASSDIPLNQNIATDATLEQIQALRSQLVSALFNADGTPISNPDLPSTVIQGPFVFEAELDIKSYVAEFSYFVTDELNVTAGMRYIDETRFTRNTFATANGPFTFEGEGDFSDTLPRFAVSYDIQNNWNVYASYARGRRSPVVDANAGGVNITDAEIVDSFDVGLKYQSANFMFTGAMFTYEYSNFQQSFTDPETLQSITVTVGDSSMSGIEGMAVYNHSDTLTLTGSLGFLDAEFANDTADGSPFEYGGNKFRLAPEVSGAFNINKLFYVDAWTVDVNWLTSFQSTVFFESSNYPGSSQDTYSLTDVSIKLNKNDSQFAYELYINNLFDKEYLIDAGNTGGGLGIPTNVRGMPRIAGVRVYYEF